MWNVRSRRVSLIGELEAEAKLPISQSSIISGRSVVSDQRSEQVSRRVELVFSHDNSVGVRYSVLTIYAFTFLYTEDNLT
jgi:hypothetical protein